MDNNTSSKCSDISDNKTAGYASYKEQIDDKYILKTKIVPPKGTPCPSKISDPASNYLNGHTSTSIVENSSNSNSISNSLYTYENYNDKSQGSNDQSNKNIPAPANDALIQNSTALNEIKDIKGTISQINQQKPKSDTCPPCPACERCPEPAFDCKKVPNYRSPSIGQYLPMPILNDFSTF
jgi:hypothetical protein